AAVLDPRVIQTREAGEIRGDLLLEAHPCDLLLYLRDLQAARLEGVVQRGQDGQRASQTMLEIELAERTAGEPSLVVQLIRLQSSVVAGTDLFSQDERFRRCKQGVAGPKPGLVADEAHQIPCVQGIGKRQVRQQVLLRLLRLRQRGRRHVPQE